MESIWDDLKQSDWPFITTQDFVYLDKVFTFKNKDVGFQETPKKDLSSTLIIITQA